MQRTTWKYAFWITFIMLIMVAIGGIYKVADDGVTMTYMREGYTDTETDLNSLIALAERSNLTKGQVQSVLKNRSLIPNFTNDTVPLERIIMIFEDDTLKKVELQW